MLPLRIQLVAMLSIFFIPQYSYSSAPSAQDAKQAKAPSKKNLIANTEELLKIPAYKELTELLQSTKYQVRNKIYVGSSTIGKLMTKGVPPVNPKEFENVGFPYKKAMKHLNNHFSALLEKQKKS